MKQVFNTSRYVTSKWDIPTADAVWISISEPGIPGSVIQNDILDKFPKLSISFWDLTQSIEHKNEILHPPSEKDAKTIVDFLLLHKGKNVVVNCAAGISRSGAVAQFCYDFLGYDWPEAWKRNAVPNFVLYNMMRDYYLGLQRVTIEEFKDYVAGWLCTTEDFPGDLEDNNMKAALHNALSQFDCYQDGVHAYIHRKRQLKIDNE